MHKYALRSRCLMLLPLALISCPAPASEMAYGSDSAVSKSHVAKSLDGEWGTIVTGRLQNGVRFAILPRRNHESGVGILVRIEGGFIAERRPGERGLAHLIEHIAFESPTKAAPSDLNHFRRIGMSLTLPAPSAGSTSWRETNYFLSTKSARTADLDKLLALFRETVSDLTFRSDAVDDQRVDVMREMATRKLGNDIYARYVAAVAPGSPTDLIDAQNSDDVPTASIETIRGLYHRLYRPENTMIVVVGNVNPVQIAALIRRRFGGWKAVGPAPVPAPIPEFQVDRIAPISYSDFQQGRRIALMTVAMPMRSPPPTRKRQAEATLMDMVETRAVSNRMASAQPDSPIGKIGIHIENGEQGDRRLLMWDNFGEAPWRPAIAGLNKLTCDLDTTGLSDREWSTAKADVIEDLEERTKDMVDTPNVELAKDLSHAFAAGQELIPPEALLHYARSWLPTVNAQTGNRWWRQQWNAGVQHIRVESPELAQIEDPISAIRKAADGAVEDVSCKVPLGAAAEKMRPNGI
ncbi:MAG TPA: insulinase family protein [Sphingomonas sp.]